MHKNIIIAVLLSYDYGDLHVMHTFYNVHCRDFNPSLSLYKYPDSKLCIIMRLYYLLLKDDFFPQFILRILIVIKICVVIKLIQLCQIVCYTNKMTLRFLIYYQK